jgi:hypothetical protein
VGGSSRLGNPSSSSKPGPRSSTKAAGQQQQQQRGGKGSAAKHDASQAKLDMFFSTTPAAVHSTRQQQQQQQQRQQQHVLSQVPLGRVTNFGTPASAAAGRLGAKAAPGLFSTPAAGLKGPLAHLQQQQQPTPQDSLTAGSRLHACQQQAAAGAGLSPAAAAAAAAAVVTAPWNAPLTADEAQLDKFDLVNWKVFGHRSFRPQQKDIVMQAVAGRDLFVLMPTGGGKSLCYQVGLCVEAIRTSLALL